MKYIAVLLLVAIVCAFALIPKTNDISITASSDADKNDLEIGALETVKYFGEFKQELKNGVKIVAEDQPSLRSTLVAKYKVSESEADQFAAGRGFYTGDTIIVNTRIANSSVLKIATVAHELTHHYQRQIINSTGSILWLQEGMADFTAGNILERTHQGTVQLLPVSRLNLSPDLDLANLRSDEEWLKAVKNFGGTEVYAFSSIAVRELVSQAGYWGLISFHNELNKTKNIEQSFKSAFFIELREFEKKFSEDIKKGNLVYYRYY